MTSFKRKVLKINILRDCDYMQLKKNYAKCASIPAGYKSVGPLVEFETKTRSLRNESSENSEKISEFSEDVQNVVLYKTRF